MIRDLTRHIVLPYSFDYTIASSVIQSLKVMLPSFSILQSKQYTFRNFRCEVKKLFTTASTSPLSFEPPAIFLKGINSNEGISDYLNSFVNVSAYTYKGILSNPDLSAETLETNIFTQTNFLQLTGTVAGLGSNNIPNFIEAKQTLTNSYTGASFPSVYTYFRYDDDFYFLNNNFKQIYFCFNLPSQPVDASKSFPTTFNFLMTGFFAFDLDQYSA